MNEFEILRDKLWNGDSTDEKLLLEQYKLYVVSSDGISQRRHSANTFFLTFNTALMGALAGFLDKIKDNSLIDSFYLAALILCISWIVILRSYRNLNTAKFKVIGLMEERLPCSPYWSAEWASLGFGKDWQKYVPLSLIETTAPIAFGAIYLFLLSR